MSPRQKITKLWSIHMYEIREIIRLYFVESLNRNQISQSLGKSYSSVTSVIQRVKDTSLDVEVLLASTDDELHLLMYPNKADQRARRIASG